VLPTVFVDAGSYYPEETTGGLPGVQVNWTWTTGEIPESVTSMPLGLFDSGAMTMGNYSYSFESAGTFSYDSTVDASQVGTVAVSICDLPTSTTVGTTVYGEYAQAHQRGYVEDIKWRTPGATKWSWYARGQKGTEFSFAPDETGAYEFRARMREPSTHHVSGWSPTTTMTVS
jgi:hypothetical protein